MPHLNFVGNKLKNFTINKSRHIIIFDTKSELDLQTRKLSFIQKFLRVQNEDIMTGLDKMLKNLQAELYENNLESMSMKEFNSDIDKSWEDSANDRVISAKELKENVKKWN